MSYNYLQLKMFFWKYTILLFMGMFLSIKNNNKDLK